MVPGDECRHQKFRFGKTYPCRYYRAPCSRLLHECPFGFHIHHRCDHCETMTHIGDIHFVHEEAEKGLVETKFRYLTGKHIGQDATSLCGGCLDHMKESRKHRTAGGGFHWLRELMPSGRRRTWRIAEVPDA